MYHFKTTKSKNKSVKTCGLVFALCVGVISFSQYVHAESFLDALKNYCVPTSSDGCTGQNNVSTIATYKNGHCECPTTEQYYDASTRACQDCIQGSTASADYKTCEPPTCPAGYRAVLIENGNCPTGFTLKLVNK